MIYNMYKPVAEDSIDKVNALLNFYKKTYNKIVSANLKQNFTS